MPPSVAVSAHEGSYLQKAAPRTDAKAKRSERAARGPKSKMAVALGGASRGRDAVHT